MFWDKFLKKTPASKSASVKVTASGISDKTDLPEKYIVRSGSKIYEIIPEERDEIDRKLIESGSQTQQEIDEEKKNAALNAKIKQKNEKKEKKQKEKKIKVSNTKKDKKSENNKNTGITDDFDDVDVNVDDLNIRALNKLLKSNIGDSKIDFYTNEGKKESELLKKNQPQDDKSAISEKEDQLLRQLEYLNKKADEVDTNINSNLLNDVSVYVEDQQISLNSPDDHLLSGFGTKDYGSSDTNMEIFKDKTLLSTVTNASTKTKLIMIASMGAAVLVFVIAAVLIAINLPKSASKQQLIVSQSTTASNNANFIFVYREATINGEALTLQKMQVDSLATIFYFNRSFDQQNYDFSLIDDTGRLYSMDLNYVANTGNQPIIATELHFEPLMENIKEFTLTMTDVITKEKAEFVFPFAQGIVYPPTKYIDKPIMIDNDAGLVLELNNAKFSTTGSILNFKLESSDKEAVISFLPKKNEENIMLYEQASKILPSRKDPVNYSFSNSGVTLLQMNFGPLKNLDTKIEIQFKNLFHTYGVDHEITLPPSFLNSTSSPITLPLNDEINLVLEGVGISDEQAILVLHSEKPRDENIPTSDIYDNRFETQLDVELIAEISNGVTLIFQGTQYSGKVGTDILFDLGTSGQLVSELPADKLKIKISSVFLKTDDISIPIDLNNQKFKQSAEAQAATAAVTDAFISRLIYRSGQLSLVDIEGFTPEALQAEIKDYQPYNALTMTNKPMISAQIITYAIDGDTFHGIVQEQWKLSVEGKDTKFYRKHEVTAKLINGKWIITYDKILR